MGTSFEAPKHETSGTFTTDFGVLARLERGEDAASVLLELPCGERWLFEAAGAPLAVEESVLFASPDGARACEQIVVSGRAEPGAEVQWAFSRT